MIAGSTNYSPDPEYILIKEVTLIINTGKMMDILLSLPIISVFFGGSMTSWSTSLNLLFFYMTWSTLVLSHDPLYIELFGTLAIRLIIFLLPSLLFLLFDTLLPSLAESIKHGGASALPPRDPRALAKTTLLALTNLLLETALEAAASLGLTHLTGHVPFRSTTTLPLPWQILKQLGLLYLSREVLTYHIHRYLLHRPHPQIHTHISSSTTTTSSSFRAPVRTARAWVARQHARTGPHARPAAPYSLSLAAEHPVPFLLHRLAPVYAPALGVRPHLLVYFLFVGLVTLEETLAMSGYTVVPGFVMGGVARRNAAHYGAGYEGADSGNYGAWGVLDWGCGTGKGRGGGGIGDDVRLEAERHRGVRKGRRNGKRGNGSD
ncbi:hypothetical protein VPNG_04025 [Cytospora leucostoma]|uniref:Fatty acid hydroxylase domain-containing protein n=1 Tax=Cytospora leucostoma TaxID=1230097 RepID=A0A423XDM7_9PEZI|nr:hypothetical protein VPNG_04025 [Cytospora leucostoma]